MAAVRRPHWSADPCPNWQCHRCLPTVAGPCDPGPQSAVEGCTSALERQRYLPWCKSPAVHPRSYDSATQPPDPTPGPSTLECGEQSHQTLSVVDSEAWRQEGQCKLCLVSMDSYDHICRERTHPAIADTRARLLKGILKQNSTFTGNEALLAATLLRLYQGQTDTE